MTGIVGDLPCGSTGQLVGFAFNKAVEGKRTVQAADVLGDHTFTICGFGWSSSFPGRLRWHDGLWRYRCRCNRLADRCNRSRSVDCCWCRFGLATAANQQAGVRYLTIVTFGHQLQQAGKIFVVDPVQYKAVGGIDQQAATGFLSL